MFKREWTQGIASPTTYGEQHARLYPRIGKILTQTTVGTNYSRAQQHRRCLRTERMPGCGDAAFVEASLKTRNRIFYKGELIEDALDVLYAIPPHRKLSWVVEVGFDCFAMGGTWISAQCSRIKKGRLDDDKAMCGPEVCKRSIGIHRRAEAV